MHENMWQEVENCFIHIIIYQFLYSPEIIILWETYICLFHWVDEDGTNGLWG